MIVIGIIVIAVIYAFTSFAIEEISKNARKILGGFVMILILIGSIMLGISIGGPIGGIVIIGGIILMYVIGNKIMGD